MNRLMKLFVLLTLLLGTQQAVAQKVKAQIVPDYSSHPYWITMMDDPSVNYFEAVKAYDAYWTKHEKPLDEEKLMTSGTEAVKEHQKKLSKRERKKQDEEQLLAFQSKRFEHWLEMMKPYVQDDGRILSPAERLELWKAEKK